MTGKLNYCTQAEAMVNDIMLSFFFSLFLFFCVIERTVTTYKSTRQALL